MSKIGIQMYTMRDHMRDKADLENTLKRLAEIGYKNVQITTPSYLSITEMVELLAEYGIKADSAFCTTGRVVENIGSIVREAKILGIDVVRTDSIPAELQKSEDGYMQFASLLNEQGKILKDNGLKYIYHFHSFEFVTFGARRGIDILLDETDPEAVMFQPDVFWLTSAGTEPSVSLKMFAGRAFYMHVKDYAIKQLQGAIENVPFYFAPVGTGNLNWPGIMKTANEIGIKQFVVEQDICDGDVFEAVKTSYDNLKKLGIED